jgi:alternate signal-mediated exported protein
MPGTARAPIPRAPSPTPLSLEGGTMNTASQTPLSESTAQGGRNRRAGKAVLAGAVAVGLLAAGGGTFSKWSDDKDVFAAGTSVSTGKLQLGSVGNAQWADQRGAITEFDTFEMVPGDSLSYTVDSSVIAEGKNITGTLSVDTSELPAGIQQMLAHGALGYDVTISGLTDQDPDNDGKYQVTPADNGKAIKVTAEITWPEHLTDGQSMQDQNFALDAMKLTLLQNV